VTGSPGSPVTGLGGAVTGSPGSEVELAAAALDLLIARGQTVAVAESLTGGLVAAALTSVPGSSAAFRGGVVAYATELKTALLGVPADLLARHGPVHEAVAAAMASGVRASLGATFGLATTGVAGPGPADGHQAGTVFVAVAGPAGPAGAAGASGASGAAGGLGGPSPLAGIRGSGLRLAGGRAEVRAEAVRGVLSLLLSALQEEVT
jgi:nicotinamide-nucleotide amidase